MIVSWDHPVFTSSQTPVSRGCACHLTPYSISVSYLHTLTLLAPRYLTDSSHRETFESAHSVVLAIFASHAQQQQTGLSLTIGLPITSNRLEANAILKSSTESNDRRGDARDYQVPEISATRPPTPGNETHDSATFVQQTIPFYVQCLIKVSSCLSVRIHATPALPRP